MANWLDKFEDGGETPKGPSWSTTLQNNSYYEPLTNTIYLSDADKHIPGVGPHEMFHYWQNLYGDDRILELYQGPLKQPTIPSGDGEAQKNYWNRRAVDQEYITNDFLSRNPSFKLAHPQVVYDKAVNPAMYNNPYTLEGEARNFENQFQGPSPYPQDYGFKHGGLIKRADGSYSRRGLWDNIRANKGSGRKPTPEMLEQERKIKKHADGNFVKGENPPATFGNLYADYMRDWTNSPMGQQMLQKSISLDNPSGRLFKNEDSYNNASIAERSLRNVRGEAVNSNYSKASFIKPYWEQMRDARINALNNVDFQILPNQSFNSYLNTSGDYNLGANEVSNTAGQSKFSLTRKDFNNFIDNPTVDKFREVTRPENVDNINYLPYVANPYRALNEYAPSSKFRSMIRLRNNVADDNLADTSVHELSHTSDWNGVLMPQSDVNLIESYSKNAPNTEWGNYVKTPTETRARLNALRFGMKNQGIYNPFVEKATMKAFDSYKPLTDDSYDPLLQLRSIYTDEQILDMMNTISRKEPSKNSIVDNTQYAKDGGWIHMYADGDVVGEDPKPVTPTSTPISYNTNDFYITPDEIELYKQRAEECHSKGQCLEQAFRFYDKYVAPNLGTPNSWDIKKNAGISSGATNPNFNQYGESADSWDIHGLLQEKGATKILAANVKNPMSIEQNLSKMTPSQQEDYFISLNIPLGSVIGMGSSGTNKSSTSYNSKLGLVDSNHSATVIGYNERGVPMIFDYGEIKPITSRTFASDAFPITNITAPKETAQYTYEYLKANNKLQNDYTPLNLKTNTTEYDEDEYIPFIDALKNNKAKYANAFGLTNTEYDEFAKKAAALALTETKGGDDNTWRGIIPTYITDKLGLGDTTGITQINSDMIFNSKELSKKLEAVGITKDNYDPWNSDHIAAATIALLKSNVRPAERAYNINTQKLGYDPGLSDAAITYYQWNQPSLLIKGEAKGESEKVKKFQNNYNLIDIGDYLQLNPEGTPSINLPEVKVEYKKGDGSWVNMYGNGSKVTTNKPPQKTLKQALLDYKENADENKWEFIDISGLTSWDDAARGYDAWQKSGRTLPTLTESMDMFSAVPLLGKAKQIETGIKHTVQSARKIPWNKIYGAVDYLRDEYNDKIDKKNEGSWVTDSSLPTPTTPSFYDAYPDRTLTNYQMGTDKAPMYGGGGGVQPFITSDINEYNRRKQAYADSSYAHNVGLANWKNAQLNLKQNVDKFNAQLPSAFGHIIGPSVQLDKPYFANSYYSPVPIRGIWPTKAAHQYTVPHQYLSELQYLNLYHNPSFYEPLTGDALKSYNQNHTGIFYFPYDEADKYHASVNLYDAPKQQVIFDKNAPKNKITKTIKSLPTPVKNNTEIKKEEIEPITRKFDFSIDEDLKPIAPTPYVPNPVRRVMNPAFDFNIDFEPNRTKEAVVDQAGNPRYKYYNGDKVITEQEYNKLIEKKANGGPVMYNAGSTVWTKQNTPLWAAGTPTPTATQNFKNDRSLNTDLYRIGDVIPTGMNYKTPAAGTYDYSKDIQPYHTMRLHAPDTTMMARHGSYVKKHINSPRVYGSPVNPSGMSEGPTTQRGITFGKGGLISKYADAGFVGGNDDYEKAKAQYVAARNRGIMGQHEVEQLKQKYPQLVNDFSELNFRNQLNNTNKETLSYEQQIDKKLGHPQEKAVNTAKNFVINRQKQNLPNILIDNLRHATAAKNTSEGIQNLLPSWFPGKAMLGFIGTNALGLGHEVSVAYDKYKRDDFSFWPDVRESAEDMFNNAFGAAVGSMPFLSEDQKTNIIQNAVINKQLPDGKYDYDKADLNNYKNTDYTQQQKNGGKVMFGNGSTVGGGGGNNPVPAGFMTYESNPNYFDSHAVLYDQNLNFNDTAKRLIYEGKAAFNPTTGELRFMNSRPASAETQQMASRKYGEMNELDRTAATRKVRMDEADKMNQQIADQGYSDNWRQELATSTQSTGDRFRFSLKPNLFDDYFNPGVWFGDMASGLGQAPYQAQQTNSIMPYFKAVATPVTAGLLTNVKNPFSLDKSGLSGLDNYIINPRLSSPFHTHANMLGDSRVSFWGGNPRISFLKPFEEQTAYPANVLYKKWGDRMDAGLGVRVSEDLSPIQLKNAHRQVAKRLEQAGFTPDPNYKTQEAKLAGLLIKQQNADKLTAFAKPTIYENGVLSHYTGGLAPKKTTDFLASQGYDIAALTPEENLAIDAYSRGYDDSINSANRRSSIYRQTSEYPRKDSFTEHADNFIKETLNKDLDAAIAKNKIKNPIVVRRGIGKDYPVTIVDKEGKILGSKLRSQLEIGDHIIDDSFMSTSHDLTHSWGNPEFAESIELPAGQSYGFPDASTFTQFGNNEHEIMLPRNLIREITGINPKTTMSYDTKYFSRVVNPHKYGGYIKNNNSNTWLDNYN